MTCNKFTIKQPNKITNTSVREIEKNDSKSAGHTRITCLNDIY